MTPSVRRPVGERFVVFNRSLLSDPQHNCQLTYRLEEEQIVVEKQSGLPWIALDMSRGHARRQGDG